MTNRASVFAISVTLCACTVGPDFRLPAFIGRKSWKNADVSRSMELPDDWWRLYGDGTLDSLVQRAINANNDLSAARARVNTARALVGLDRARMFPALSFNGSANSTRIASDPATRNLPSGIDVDLQTPRYRGTFDLAYDPDLWGRNRRSMEASAAEATAAEAMYDSMRLGLAAEVCRQYYLIRGLDSQRQVLDETLVSRRETRDMLRSKADAGLIDSQATAQADTQISLAENDLAAISRQRGAAEHALAVLCGTLPSDFSLPPRPLKGKLPQIRPGLPASVLARRPDVRAAENTLRAANARIGVAEAAFYPNFSLSAGVGFESLDVKRFLSWENRILSLGAGVAAPILEGGTNRANFNAAVSRRDEALANYRNTLLTALREVEDSLVDLKTLADSENALRRALSSAQDSEAIAKERYRSGLSSYLEVTEAQRATLGIRTELAQVEAQQRISLATLAKSLGGGWSGK